MEQLGALECEWIRKHPERSCSKEVKRDRGEAAENNIVIVRGKSPRAAGQKNSTIFLLREGKEEIVEMGAYRIDGEKYLPGVFYNVKGRKVK